MVVSQIGDPRYRPQNIVVLVDGDPQKGTSNLGEKFGGIFWGVPIKRTVVFWCLYWGPLSLGNYHIS